MYKDLSINFHTDTNLSSIEKFLISEKFGSIFFLDHSMNNISQSIISNKYAKIILFFRGHPITMAQKIWIILFHHH